MASNHEQLHRQAARSAKLRRLVKSIGKVDREKALPTIGVFAETLIDEFGGIRQLCQAIVGEYRGAPKGSQTRQRLLESASRIITAAARSEGAKEPQLEDLSDEDLAAALADEKDAVEDALAEGGDDGEADVEAD